MSSILVCAILSMWIYNTGSPTHFTPLIQSDRVAVMSDNGMCVVVFRGTDSIYDFYEDIMSQADQRCSASGFITHFEESFEAIGDDTHVGVKSTIDNECGGTVYFTGHSLGGAMATIAPHKYGLRDYKVITFGEPKTCCWDMSTGEDTLLITRVVNDKDPIPALPESTTVKNIKHCGATVLKLPSNVFAWDYNWPTLKENNRILDHRMMSYVNNLNGYINHMLSQERREFPNASDR